MKLDHIKPRPVRVLFSSRTSVLKYVITISFIASHIGFSHELPCSPDKFLYGENNVIDQLLICSIGKSQDIDLTPQGESTKTTARALVDQGFSNKTSVLQAKLNALWTAKRANLVETGWKCSQDKTTISSIVEISGLSLDLIEKLEVPLHKNQHKLLLHKPCKTLDLPLWMCRQSKSIYRMTKTWVNRAYFNLTLTQSSDSSKPQIEKLKLIFTCPETFRQKITHSPSAAYALSKFMQNIDAQIDIDHPSSFDTANQRHKRSLVNDIPIRDSHDHTFAVTQDGKSVGVPPYHNSVNSIIESATNALYSSISECIDTIDSDLSTSIENLSFRQHNKFTDHVDLQPSSAFTGMQNECSNKQWLKHKINMAELDVSQLEPNKGRSMDLSHLKRSQFAIEYPLDQNQLLDPYGYYRENEEHEIVDDQLTRQ